METASGFASTSMATRSRSDSFTFAVFYGMNFDFITIPALHVDGPIHVLQLEGTAGLQGID